MTFAQDAQAAYNIENIRWFADATSKATSTRRIDETIQYMFLDHSVLTIEDDYARASMSPGYLESLAPDPLRAAMEKMRANGFREVTVRNS